MKVRNRNLYTEVRTASQIFPYFVLNDENIVLSAEYKEELLEILKYYKVYEEGADFVTEGSGGSYIPSSIRYKTNKILVDKEARFMFSKMPDINIIGNMGEQNKEQIEAYKKIVNRVIEKNNFGQKLLKSAKDCFVGKRVACLVDMSDRFGIMLHFYTSIEFYYETDYSTGEITKFISFENVTKSKQSSYQRFLINRYEVLENGVVNVSSALYDGVGKVVETYVKEHGTDLKQIPVVVIVNDGTLKDKKGVSDIKEGISYESGYSKIANAEIDADGKGMNPIRYVVDMNQQTTKNLPVGAGAFWDLEHKSELDDPRPSVGQLAPAMNHTEPVKAAVDRLRAMMYESMDVPDISKEGLLSGITSYKALKALYYPLSVRCDEKLMVWKPAIAQIFRFVIELACLNESTSKSIYVVPEVKLTEYNINIVENYALLDDETEEKQTDMEEIATNSRSRFSYLKKWRSEELKTDDDIEKELLRIAEEANMMDTLSLHPQVEASIKNKAEEQETKELIEEAENNEEVV